MAIEYLVPSGNASGTLLATNNYTDSNNTIDSPSGVAGFVTYTDDNNPVTSCQIPLTNLVGRPGAGSISEILFRIRGRVQSYTNDDLRYYVYLRNGSGVTQYWTDEFLSFNTAVNQGSWANFTYSGLSVGNLSAADLDDWYVEIVFILYSRSKGGDGVYVEWDEMDVKVTYTLSTPRNVTCTTETLVIANNDAVITFPTPLTVTGTTETLALANTNAKVNPKEVNANTAALTITENNAVVLSVKTVACATQPLYLDASLAALAPRLVKCQTKTMDLIARTASMYHMILLINPITDEDRSYGAGVAYAASWSNSSALIDGDEDTYSSWNYIGSPWAAYGEAEIRRTNWATEIGDTTLAPSLPTSMAESIFDGEFRVKGYISDGTGIMRATADSYLGYARMVTMTNTSPAWSEWVAMTGPALKASSQDSWAARPTTKDWQPYNSVSTFCWIAEQSVPNVTKINVAKVEQRWWHINGLRWVNCRGNGIPYGEGTTADFTDTNNAWNNETCLNSVSTVGASQNGISTSSSPYISSNKSGSKGTNDLVIRGYDTQGRRPTERIICVYGRFGADHRNPSTKYDRAVCEIWTQSSGQLLATLNSDADLTHDAFSDYGPGENVGTPCPYVLLDEPTGGWTWDKIAHLEQYIYCEAGSASGSMVVWAGAQLRVGVENKWAKRKAIPKRGKVNRVKQIFGNTQTLILTENNAVIDSTTLNVSCATEVLTLAKNNAIVINQRYVTGGTETLSLANTNAGVTIIRTVAAATQNLALTNNNAAIALTRNITGATEVLSFANTNATVATNVPRVVTCSAEVLSITNTNATVDAARGVIAATETLTLTEQNANVNAEYPVDALTEPILLTVNNASVASSRLPIATTEALTLTNNNASVVFNHNIFASTEALELANTNATVIAALPLEVICATEVLALSNINATVTTNVPLTVTGTTETLTLTDANATVLFTKAVVASVEQIILTALPSTSSFNRSVVCSTESITLATNSAPIAADRGVTTATETLVIIDGNAQVFKGANLNVNGATETLSLTVQNANVNRGFALAATSESLVLTEQPATVTTNVPWVVTGATETLALSNSNAISNLARVALGTTEELVFTGIGSSVVTNVPLNIAAITEALAITAGNAQIFKGANRIVNGATETLSLAATNAVINATLGLSAATEALDLGVTSASVVRSYPVTATTEQLNLTANSATISVTRGVTAGSEGLVLSVNTATIFLGQNLNVIAVTEQMGLTVQNASILYGFIVLGSTEVINVATNSATLITSREVFANTETLILTATQASIYRFIPPSDAPSYLWVVPEPDPHIWVQETQPVILEGDI